MLDLLMIGNPSLKLFYKRIDSEIEETFELWPPVFINESWVSCVSSSLFSDRPKIIPSGTQLGAFRNSIHIFRKSISYYKDIIEFTWDNQIHNVPFVIPSFIDFDLISSIEDMLEFFTDKKLDEA